MSKDNKYSHASIMAEQMIWKFIEARRQDKGLSIEQLGSMVGLSKGNYSRYKNGHVQVPLRVILSICGALELRPFLVPAENDDSEYERIFFN